MNKVDVYQTLTDHRLFRTRKGWECGCGHIATTSNYDNRAERWHQADVLSQSETTHAPAVYRKVPMLCALFAIGWLASVSSPR